MPKNLSITQNSITYFCCQVAIEGVISINCLIYMVWTITVEQMFSLFVVNVSAVLSSFNMISPYLAYFFKSSWWCS